MQQQTLEQWEAERGFIVTDADQELLDRPMTAAEFEAIIEQRMSTSVRGVNHATRIDFLQRNGYEVNRANMTANLSVPVPPEPEPTPEPEVATLDNPAAAPLPEPPAAPAPAENQQDNPQP